MSRWATHRSGTWSEARCPSGRRSDTAQVRRELRLSRGPQRVDAAEAERARRVLVEIPVATGDERPAVVDHGGHAAPAVVEADLGPAGQRAVGHAVMGMKPAGGPAAVVVPRRGALPERGDGAGVCRAAAVQAIAGKAHPQPLL